MTICGHRIIDLLRPCRPAVFAAALAVALSLGASPAAAEPVLNSTGSKLGVAIGSGNNFSAAGVFDEAGTNPIFTGATFDTMEYYKPGSTGIRDGVLVVETRSAAYLSALPEPPDSPFTVTVDVTMENDEGETASGTLTLETTYNRVDPEEAPTFDSERHGDAYPMRAPAGTLVTVGAALVFDNAGTNPRFTKATFSTKEYYDVSRVAGGRVHVKVKSAEDLLALASPPGNPFEITADATMENDEGHEATAKIKFTTRWDNRPKDPPPPSGPTFDSAGNGESKPANAPTGTLVSLTVEGLFDNVGTNARFTKATFSNPEYLDEGYISNDRLYMKVKSDKDLLALSEPPGTPFKTTVEVTMENDEGQTASGKFWFKTGWDNRPKEEDPPPPPQTVEGGTGNDNN